MSISLECPSCGWNNPANAFFCSSCAFQLGMITHCARCDSQVQPDANFCHRCGFTLKLPKSGKRKSGRQDATTRPEANLEDLWVPCTVMVTQLVGFAGQDPTKTEEFRRQFRDWLDEKLIRAGALTVDLAEDSLVAIFRSSATDKDVPMYTVRTALALQNDLVIYNDQHESAMGFRVALQLGVSTGDLPEPPEKHMDDETFRLATLVQRACRPGSVYIAYPTFARVQGLFWYRTVEPLVVQGQMAPIPIFEMLGERESVTHVDTTGIEGVETTMIGRQAELRILRDAYQRVAREKIPEIITIVGEVGIGKSRLNYEFLKYLESLAEIISYDVGTCPADDPNAPYRLWRELILRRARIFLNDSAGVAREKLIEMVATEMRADPTLPPDLELDREEEDLKREVSEEEIFRIASGSGYLLQIPFKGMPPEGTPPELVIREAYYALQTYFEVKAEQRPSVIILDELQWADQASLELLQTLYASLPDLPILVVCLTRPEFLERRPDWVQNFNNHKLIELVPLSDDQSRVLCEQIFKKVEALPPSLVATLVERACGNPLYLEEAIKLMIRKGLIAQSLLDDKWHINPIETESFEFPEKTEELIAQQFDCIPPKTLELLERAGVIGRVFWQNWVAEMALDPTKATDKESAKPSAEQVQQQLTTLVRRGVITPKLFSQMDGDREFKFKHTLFHKLALNRLSKAKRKKYHRFVYHWFDTRRTDRRAEYLDFLALNSEGGFSYKKAFEHWQELAEAAIEFCAWANAETYLKKAMNLLSTNRLKMGGEAKIEAKFHLYETLEKIYRLQGLDEQQGDTIKTLVKIAARSRRDDLTERAKALDESFSGGVTV